MQRRALWSLSLLSAAASLASGCNDLGSCDDPARGRTTVEYGGQVMYAGQAIMLNSCATGCHASNTKGEGRQGAPAGLDFDLKPIAAGKVLTTDGRVTGVELEPAAVAGLRARQRKVFDERENIWEQVDDGLMPPGDLGKTFKDLASLAGIKFSPADKGCTRGAALTTLDASKGELRKWLACGTPVIETTSPQLPLVAPAADSTPADQAAGAFAYAGSTGYQYPTCSPGSAGGDGGVDDGGMGEGGTAATFEQVYAIFQSLDNSCLTCHRGAGAMGGFDLGSTIDSAYTKLLGADGTGGASTCNAKPKYVVPMDPANSYLLIMVDESASGRCTASVMPPFGEGGLKPAELETIRSWINAGAKRQ